MLPVLAEYSWRSYIVDSDYVEERTYSIVCMSVLALSSLDLYVLAEYNEPLAGIEHLPTILPFHS